MLIHNLFSNTPCWIFEDLSSQSIIQKSKNSWSNFWKHGKHNIWHAIPYNLGLRFSFKSSFHIFLIICITSSWEKLMSSSWVIVVPNRQMNRWIDRLTISNFIGPSWVQQERYYYCSPQKNSLKLGCEELLCFIYISVFSLTAGKPM